MVYRLAPPKHRFVDEIVAAPFVVGLDRLAVRLRCGRFAGCAGFGLPADQVVVRREVLQAVALEVGQRVELVLVHERGQLVAHLLDAAVADLHDVGADLHGVAAEQDELGRVVARFDAADARQRSAGEFGS